MKPNHTVRHQSVQGSTLLIVLMVLLLASLMSLFAVRVGLFEQRSSGNDLRARIVQNIADDGLTQGIEFVYANMGTLLNSDTGWTNCGANDTSFPCGAVVASRRATMKYYSGGTTGAAPLNAGNFIGRFIPFANPIPAAAGNFNTVYGVGVVKCRLVPKPLGSPAECTTGAHTAGGFYAVTLVSVAAMDGENARATAIKTFVSNSVFPSASGKPPVMASGTITLRGGIQIVTNPNAAGPGVPVSVWTRKPLDAGGTPDTCYQDEFYRTGSPTWFPATGGSVTAADQILRCDNCDCGTGALTSGSGNSCNGGSDILANPSECGPNQPVLPQEFPCDLFQHVFGVKAWDDNLLANGSAGQDFFCETLKYTDDPTDTNAADGVRQIGVDEAYLSEKANWIVTNTTGFGARFVGDSRVIACNQVPGKSGLVWVRTGQCGDNITIGSPTAPVLFVHDGNGNNSPSLQNMVLFGLMFVRSTYPYPVCNAPSAGAACPNNYNASGNYALNAVTGGTPEFKLNGRSVIYGSAVVQGLFNKGNGTSAVVYNDKVLGNLSNTVGKPQVYPLPGAWTDRVQY